MIKSVDWSSLQAFLILAREERLTTAAKKAGIDHSTLKRKITDLETNLGTALFERKPTGYILTAEGKTALATIEEMESVTFKLEDAHRTKQTVSGIVRIASSNVFGEKFLSRSLGALSQMYPELELQLVANPTPSGLTKRETDLAITGSRPEHGHLHSRKLADYELGLYTTRSYLDESGRIGCVDDLNKHRLIGYIDDLAPYREMSYLPNMDPRLKMCFRSTHILCQLEAVRSGAGLAVVPCWLVEDDPAFVRVLNSEIALVSSFWLTVKSDMRDIAAVRIVSKFITAEIEKFRHKLLPNGSVGLKPA